MQLSEEKIERAVHILKNGGVIGYPTETVYGLGGDAMNTAVIKRILHLKDREKPSPLLVLVPDIDFVKSLVTFIPDQAKLLIKTFWPGPLTLIFEASDQVPYLLVGGTDKIGIRVSSDPVCQQLLTVYQHPLISTSANKTGLPPALNADMVHSCFPNVLDLVLDDGERSMSLPSTILDVTTEPVRLVRAGGISKRAIVSVVGAIDVP